MLLDLNAPREPKRGLQRRRDGAQPALQIHHARLLEPRVILNPHALPPLPKHTPIPCLKLPHCLSQRIWLRAEHPAVAQVQLLVERAHAQLVRIPRRDAPHKPAEDLVHPRTPHPELRGLADGHVLWRCPGAVGRPPEQGPEHGEDLAREGAEEGVAGAHVAVKLRQRGRQAVEPRRTRVQVPVLRGRRGGAVHLPPRIEPQHLQLPSRQPSTPHDEPNKGGGGTNQRDRHARLERRPDAQRVRADLEAHRLPARAGAVDGTRVHPAARARAGLVHGDARGRGAAVPRLVQREREEGGREAADAAAEDADRGRRRRVGGRRGEAGGGGRRRRGAAGVGPGRTASGRWEEEQAPWETHGCRSALWGRQLAWCAGRCTKLTLVRSRS